ncbi:YegP family protein [Nonlabens xiamenensis]|uniref:YegP family protein n=1 Tax=Nonlabens xiamenensis TaxID=2341043 RepID=UPI000F60D58F|nr:YegP family protein [Nonlabens xiamenensis]
MGKFEKYNGSNGDFRFRLKAGNGQNILASEGYTSASGRDNGIESVKKNSADENRYELKETASGKWHFNLKASNGQVIGSSQSYSSESSAKAGMESVMNNAPGADVVDAD